MKSTIPPDKRSSPSPFGESCGGSRDKRRSIPSPFGERADFAERTWTCGPVHEITNTFFDINRLRGTPLPNTILTTTTVNWINQLEAHLPKAKPCNYWRRSSAPRRQFSSNISGIEQWDENFTTTHCMYPVWLRRQWTLCRSDMKTMWTAPKTVARNKNWLSTWKYTSKQPNDWRHQTRVSPL